MYEQVETGPLYDQVVQLMSTYRSVAARMANARPRTQGKLDRRLERLGEKIAERLAELTFNERMALTGWRDGIIAGTYEVDHEALMAQPYESIRRIDRWTEEYDVIPHEEDNTTQASAAVNTLLQRFLREGLD